MFQNIWSINCRNLTKNIQDKRKYCCFQQTPCIILHFWFTISPEYPDISEYRQQLFVKDVMIILSLKKIQTDSSKGTPYINCLINIHTQNVPVSLKRNPEFVKLKLSSFHPRKIMCRLTILWERNPEYWF